MNEQIDAAEAVRRWDVHARALMDGLSPEHGDPHRLVLLNPVHPHRGHQISLSRGGETTTETVFSRIRQSRARDWCWTYQTSMATRRR